MAFSVSLVTLSPDYNLKGTEKELEVVRKALMKLLDDGKPDFDDWVVGLEVGKDRYLQLEYLHSLVFYWAVLESFVKKVLIKVIEFDKTGLSSDVLNKIKVPMGDYFTLRESERSAYVADEIIDSSHCKKYLGFGRFDCVLALCGLSGKTLKKHSKSVLELQQIRNCFVHNESTIDKTFTEKCPWMKDKVGDKLRLSRENLIKYHEAVTDYLFHVGKLFEQKYPESKHFFYPSRIELNFR